MKIDSGRIIERVMRMGIESRSGVPDEQLWDLATKQLKEGAKVVTTKSKFESLQDWFETCKIEFSLAYALVYDKSGTPTVLKFRDFPDALKYRFDGWASSFMPRLTAI